MFTLSAKYYDALYRALGKDYASESARVCEILDGRGVARGAAVLDAACGTGAHLAHLQDRYACEGLDIERSMLVIAGQRVPSVPLHHADLISFNLGKKFDAILCLFSSIGYVPNVLRLNQTLQTFARHLNPGGVAIVEPWFTPDQWVDGRLSALYVDEPDLKVARMTVSRSDRNVAIMNFQYMVGSADGIRTFSEAHRLTLFTRAEYEAAFRAAGFRVEFDEQGLMQRGLYIGQL